MSKLGECLSNCVLSLKFILSIVNCVLKIGGTVLMPTGYKKVTSAGSDEWQISSPHNLNKKGEASMYCPNCNTYMRSFQVSPAQLVYFCPLCATRIVLTQTIGNRTIYLTPAADDARITVPQAFQDAFSEEEVLEP